MNRDLVSKIVRDTFTQSFDKSRFLDFTRNLLNHIDESKATARNSQYIKDAFKLHVQRCERLGTYTVPSGEKLDILVVHLTEASKLERARTALRNFVADHLKTRDGKDAALVAFVSPSEKTWRFSYVKMEYATVKKDSGKIGVETRLTPARRFSYIVGEDESCHTAQTRFLNLLQDTETDPSLADIEEAFSVEAVAREFFLKYKALFDEIEKKLAKLLKKDKAIREEFERKGVNTVDFAKKLMGQIVFLYFLQKKGWLGVAKGEDWGSGPHDFLRRLAKEKYGEYDNFFNDILEPLFYDTLATDRAHESWCNRFKCRIPFLNGGLFEPLGNYDWRKTDIALPNRLFANSDFVEEGITGTGVLDVFDRYNFTVEESTPLEKEVAIDPEMLGKVFENLIEDNRRKGLGAYYTPREIVHYMCQESLINYLDTAVNKDEKHVPREDIETFIRLGEQISHYEAVDAVYKIKMPKNIERHARLIDEKLAEITVCDPAVGSGAFPVGMMHEIVHARLALTPYFNDHHERTPYHFKRHAIQNCLYGVDIDAGAVEIAKLRLWLSLVVDEEDERQIKPLPNLDYKIVAGNSLLGVERDLLNENLFQELEILKQQFFDETNATKKGSLKRRIDDLIHQITNGKEQFDFKIFFSAVFRKSNGFDVVIANPPYVEHKKLKAISQILKKIYDIYSGTADLYVYFFEKGLNLLRDEGILTFITSNKFIKTSYGSNLRRRLSRKRIKMIVDFGGIQVFNALVASCIIQIEQSLPTDEVLICFVDDNLKKNSNLGVFIEEKSFRIASSTLTSDIWQLDTYEQLDLKAKIENAGRPLSSCRTIRIYRGVTTGYNPAFIVDSRTKDVLLAEDKSNREILKPLLQGRNIRKWTYLASEYSLIFSKIGIDIHQYPYIKAHLERYKTALTPGVGRKPGSYKWYEIQDNTAYYPEFEKEKIIWGLTADKWAFAYDNKKHYLPSNGYILTSTDIPIKYILAILNSQLMKYYFGFIGIMTAGGAYTLKHETVKKFPLVMDLIKSRSSVIALVDKILSAKKQNPETDTTELEREIDQLVYKLYDLTPEEIAIVEDSTRTK